MIAPVLFLFDIDGTLLRTRGAGREALDEAFAQVCGFAEATRGVPIGGSTDGAIVRGVAARFGLPWGPADPSPFDLAALQTAYLAGLRRRLQEPGRIERCPGVIPLLDALAEAGPERAHLALLTGNWEAGAEVKLGAAGLSGRFAFGAFGDDAVDRNALVPVACSRAEARGLRWRKIVVLGDTPADIACARAGGAVAVAVETGMSTPEELARSGPDLQLKSFEEGGAWVRALLA
jgi:phosphoglycolate phosphatase-like HAD superfamily hydrolase